MKADRLLADYKEVDVRRVDSDDTRHFMRAALALAHAVANHLAAAELHFLAVNGVVFLHFDPEVGIRKSHAIACGRAEHLRISLSSDRTCHQSFPMIFA